MGDMSIINFYWRILVNEAGRLGLPVDKHIVAFVLVALFVYCLGYVSKAIVDRDE